MDTLERTWQSTESLLGHELRIETRHSRGSFSPASGFALVTSISDEVTLELKSRIPLCFPCQSRISTL